MAILRNKQKLAALNKENVRKFPGTTWHKTQVLPNHDYFTQVSEERESRITKKLSKEFNRTESRILGALIQLDELFLNPLLQGHSGSAP